VYSNIKINEVMTFKKKQKKTKNNFIHYAIESRFHIESVL